MLTGLALATDPGGPETLVLGVVLRSDAEELPYKVGLENLGREARA